MNALLSTSLFAPFEATLNALLKQDPASAMRLRPYLGKCLRIECTNPVAMTAYLLVEDERLSLRSIHEGDSDAAISASAGAFATLLMSRSQTDALFTPSVVLAGDTHLVQALHRIIAGLEIDWEDHFANVFGDVATHQLGEWTRRARAWAQKSRKSVVDDIEEYLHEEARILPTKSEFTQFNNRVDELKLRLDRIQAKTQRLLSTLNTH